MLNGINYDGFEINLGFSKKSWILAYFQSRHHGCLVNSLSDFHRTVDNG
jgi:hypothetical protein